MTGWLSVSDAALLCQVSERTIRRWITDGLPSQLHGGQRQVNAQTLIDRGSVDGYTELLTAIAGRDLTPP